MMEFMLFQQPMRGLIGQGPHSLSIIMFLLRFSLLGPVFIYQTIRWHIPVCSNLHRHRRENLKSHTVYSLFLGMCSLVK